jgi:hypothetical protein
MYNRKYSENFINGLHVLQSWGTHVYYVNEYKLQRQENFQRVWIKLERVKLSYRREVYCVYKVQRAFQEQQQRYLQTVILSQYRTIITDLKQLYVGRQRQTNLLNDCRISVIHHMKIIQGVSKKKTKSKLSMPLCVNNSLYDFSR